MSSSTETSDWKTSDDDDDRRDSISGLSEIEIRGLIAEIKDYQITHGSLLKLVRYEEETTSLSRQVNASVLPTVFPRPHFNQALALQCTFNELYVRAACDEEWLYGVLEPLLSHDDLAVALWDIHLQVKRVGAQAEASCGIFRSDYMLHRPSDACEPCLKQVEMNTFSVAGACHAEKMAGMYRHLQRVKGLDKTPDRGITQLPENCNTRNIVASLKAANDLYRPTTAKQICVLMIVQPLNFNIADERPIEYALWDSGVPCYRCEWQDVLRMTSLTDNYTLVFQPSIGNVELEISVVYYRAGYDAVEYRQDIHGADGKDVRLRLEVSRAIKCPDVLTHLTTFKSVQQALTEPGTVERFLSNKAEAVEVRSTFMPMLAFGTSSASAHEARSVAYDPEQAKKYVLKPNLEGGGHNTYRDKIPGVLSSLPTEQWQKHILMRLIEPPEEVQGMLLTPEDLYVGPVVSELGVLGTCLWRRPDRDVEFLENNTVGWTFKTKPMDVDEMSVVKGYGCFDSPALVESSSFPKSGV